MKLKRVAACALALSLLAVTVAGCASSGAKANNQACYVSKRTQLTCLRRVWKAGMLSTEAYNREWHRILDNN
jgi:hypothetical protein